MKKSKNRLDSEKKQYDSNKMAESRKQITVLLFTIIFVLLFGLILKTNNVGEINISPKSLVDIYNEYDGTPGFDHWLEYATHYDVHLQQLLENIPKSNTFRMLEIGVQSGGSVEVWKSYFSARPLYYVGMDIQPRCKRSEDISQNIFIEIGSQTSPEDLIRICKKHGPFDFIVDDGGHTYEMMKTAVNTLFPNDLCMTRNSLYALEDMHTMAIASYCSVTTDIPSIPAEIFRKMHYYWYAQKYFRVSKRFKKTDWDFTDEWANSVDSIALYDSMMFIHRGNGTRKMTRIRKGKFMPY